MKSQYTNHENVFVSSVLLYIRVPFPLYMFLFVTDTCKHVPPFVLLLHCRRLYGELHFLTLIHMLGVLLRCKYRLQVPEVCVQWSTLQKSNGTFCILYTIIMRSMCNVTFKHLIHSAFEKSLCIVRENWIKQLTRFTGIALQPLLNN
jgi:hypothetical protein